jgi:hypothetical protein
MIDVLTVAYELHAGSAPSLSAACQHLLLFLLASWMPPAYVYVSKVVKKHVNCVISGACSAQDSSMLTCAGVLDACVHIACVGFAAEPALVLPLRCASRWCLSRQRLHHGPKLEAWGTLWQLCRQHLQQGKLNVQSHQACRRCTCGAINSVDCAEGLPQCQQQDTVGQCSACARSASLTRVQKAEYF